MHCNLGAILIRFVSIISQVLPDLRFFSERVIDIWNSLPPKHTDFSSLARFKRCISSFDFLAIYSLCKWQILLWIITFVCCIVFVLFCNL